jgi:RHS repeat-associated protein
MDIDLITVRTYYADIGKFLNHDRFKDKYPSRSPYQYAALNPISFIDVNGDSVDVNRL